MPGPLRLNHTITSESLDTLRICGGSASSGSLLRLRLTASRMSLAALSMSRCRVNSMLMLRGAVLAGRLDRVDALDARHGVLEHLGDAGFHHRGRRAGVGGADRDHRRIDVRQFAQRQARERDHAEHDQQQADHGREDRAVDGDVGQLHCASLLAAALAGGMTAFDDATAGMQLDRAFHDHAVAGASVRTRLRPVCAGACRVSPAPARPCRRRRRGTHSSARLPAAPRVPATPAPGACGSCTCTRSSMPGRSLPSGFGSSARTRTARVCGSTRLSMSAMRPSKFTPGHASLVAVIDWPGASDDSDGFGQGEVELDRAVVVERGDDGARCHQRAEADLAQAEHAGEGRGDGAVGDRRALGLHAGGGGIAIGAQGVVLAARDQLRLGQFGAAAQLLLGVAQRGLRRRRHRPAARGCSCRPATARRARAGRCRRPAA